MSIETKLIVKSGIEKATADLNQRFQNIGFKQTKKRQWVRLKKDSADFIHLHIDGGSYGGQPLNNSVSFTVHCGNRILNDSFESLALNGPDSNSSESIERKYHLRFNAKSGSTYERCIDDIEKFIIEIGEPWYNSIENKKIQTDEANTENTKHSYKLLDVKGIKI